MQPVRVSETVWPLLELSTAVPAAQVALMHEELVERRRWISERRFLHALNYCMLLPGPEAQQLATYMGWLMHRTWGGIVAGPDYEAASLRWIRLVVAALPHDFPVILYAKGTAPHLSDQAFTGIRVLSVDWTNDLAIVRRTLPGNIAVQGNLDPVLLCTTPAIVAHEATRLLESMRGTSGHIFNLGHGITPQAKIECMHALVDTVTKWK